MRPQEERNITQILFVEDDRFFRELVERSLSMEPGIEITGVAHDGETALISAREMSPDVVIMDIELPGQMDGIDAAIAIKQERPETGIVLLSAHIDQRYLESSSLVEGSGWSYLLKQSIPDVGTLVRAVQGSAAGMVVLDPAIVSSLRPQPLSRVGSLTPRQFEVMQLMAQGYRNAAIAERLHLSLKSIETYIGGIYQHLQVVEEGVHARVRATLLFLGSSKQTEKERFQP